MINNELEIILALKGTEATKAFADAYRKDNGKELMAYVCAKLDEKYEPQHVFEADEFDCLVKDMEVTYSLYNLVDDTADLIANDEIDEDTTLAEYIEAKLDARMNFLPRWQEQCDIEAAGYGPMDFIKALTALCKDAECVGENKEEEVDNWFGTVELNGTKYGIDFYFGQSRIADITEAENLPWDDADYYAVKIV